MDHSNFTDLGGQVYNLTIHSAVIDRDPSGRTVVYAPVSGNPAKLVIIDLKTRQMFKQIPLTDTHGAWTITVDSDHRVWIGSYRNGHVYCYNPKTEQLRDLGRAPADSDLIYGLTFDAEGNIYGGSYGSANIFSYSQAGKARAIGSVYPDKYARHLVCDAQGESLFVGVGAKKADVVKVNLTTLQKQNLLPAKYQTQSMAVHLDYVQDKLFVTLSPSHQMVVLDPTTGKPESLTNGETGENTDHVLIGSLGVSPLAPDQETVYYTYAGFLYRLHLPSLTYSPVYANGQKINLQENVISWGWIDFGNTLAGLVGNYDGKAFCYQPNTGDCTIFSLPFPPQPLDICHVTAHPAGKVYTSAFINGSMSTYDPITNQRKQYPRLGQVEGWTWDRDTLYIGTYPNAKILRYQLSQNWNPQYNPYSLFSLRQNHKQSRPQALLIHEGKLYIGTVPDYGLLGGALAIYDLQSQEEPTVLRHLIQDQSIISLASIHDQIWGGTSVEGGQGSTPKAKEAFLFCYQEEFEIYAPLSPISVKRIAALCPDPAQDLLWGIADQYLFTFDVRKRQTTWQQSLTDQGRGEGASLLFHPNGSLYATTDGQLFRIDPLQKQITAIPYQTGLHRLTRQGKDLYMKAGSSVPVGTNLIRYTP